MDQTDKVMITVECEVNVPVEKAWAAWTEVEHIVHWSLWTGWHVPRAENDLTVGGKFFSRMEDRSSGEGFDYSGVHDKVEPLKSILSHLDDGRTIEVNFTAGVDPSTTRIVQTLEPKSTYSAELQQQGWQEIMNNFKTYVERS